MVVLDVGGDDDSPTGIRKEEGAFLKAGVFEEILIGGAGRVERADGDGVDERAASGVFVEAGVVDDEVGGGLFGEEGPGVGVPAVAAVCGLDGENAAVRGDGDVEAFGLSAGASGGKGDGVAEAGRQAERLADEGFVAEADGVGAFGDDEEHVALFVAGGDVFHEAGDLPFRYGAAAADYCAVEVGGVGAELEVAVWK